MYQIDDRDRVREIHDLPQSCVGAPIPFLVEDESLAYVAYYVHRHEPGWDGSSVRVIGPQSADERVAVVRFRKYATFFGPPNDEAFSGHPLYARGLKPYGFFEVEDSSWVRSLERMNSVHPCHDRQSFLSCYRHFVLSFHDSTFECVAESYELCEERTGSVLDALQSIIEAFRSDS